MQAHTLFSIAAISPYVLFSISQFVLPAAPSCIRQMETRRGEASTKFLDFAGGFVYYDVS
jgi:hypothetical protein